MVLVLLLAGLVWVRPEQMRQIIDEEIPKGNMNGVFKVSMFFVAILFIEAIIQYIQTQMANRVAQSITLDMRSELYNHITKFKLNYFDKTPVGQFVTRLISDIDGIAEVFSVGILDIARDLIKLVVIVVFMLFINWKLTLVILIPIPILLYATRIFQLAVKKSFNDVRNEVSRINVFVQEHLTGMNIVQIFNREEREKEKFDAINKNHRDAHIRGIWAYSIFFPVVELLTAASVALMIWYGLRSSLAGNMTPGILLEFSTFITMMYRPIRQMADNFNVLQMGIINAERVFKLLDTHEAQTDTGTLSANNLCGKIEIQNLKFAYKEDKWVLNDISLNIQPGEMIAIVGATGAGKTSIAGLLNRFYDFQFGEILLDSIPIKNYSLSSLRKNICVVLQDVFLFNDSILNNITLHDKKISLEQVVEASKIVGAHHFISKLPNGYHYNIRERGGMLSAGQRQLLAFVRAYVQNFRVLVLDEATSSVDTESELLIQRATNMLTQEKTSIVIAHRLSTIYRADKIVVMDKGKIVEMGTHQQLMESNGMYHRLFELQFQE